MVQGAKVSQADERGIQFLWEILEEALGDLPAGRLIGAGSCSLGEGSVTEIIQ